MDFPGGSETESACNAEDLGSIPGLGRSPGGGMANHSSILPGESPWTGKPGRLQSMGLPRVRHDGLRIDVHVHMHTHTHICVHLSFLKTDAKFFKKMNKISKANLATYLKKYNIL